MSPGTEDDDGEEEMTLYFDAEEGTLMAENGAEIVVEMGDASSTRPSEEPESQGGGEDDGSRTPQATASAEEARRPQWGAQTITSMFPSNTVQIHTGGFALVRSLSSAS